MKYVSPESVARAKETDLLTYLTRASPGELIRVSDREYKTASHGSLRISNGKWMWWSRGIGGRSAVDYLVKVEGLSFPDAVGCVFEIEESKTVPDVIVSEHLPKKQFTLPPAAPNNDRVIHYLKSRGISESIINFCIEKGLLYESDTHHNVVFVGYDEKRIPRYASLRGTGDRVFKGEVSGSDKRYSFRVEHSDTIGVRIFEGAVDLLSFMTLRQRKGLNPFDCDLLSLSGVYNSSERHGTRKVPIALSHYLSRHPGTKEIHLHLDNDEAGRNAAGDLIGLLKDRYTVFDEPAPFGKDVNDYLCRVLKQQNKSQEGR